MSLYKEQIEHLERFLGKKSKSRKWAKNQIHRWWRRHKKEEIPNVKERKFWEW